ncbi:MAG: CBS domain-containing protein [Actinomycetota bacterium]|nr:CBS domain-containing protein [Actinomycetota bacterium]
MDIGALASRDVLTVEPDRTLSDVARQMNNRHVGSAVVVSEDGQLGIITERDVLRAVAEGADPKQTQVERYMTANAIAGSQSWSVVDAGNRMLQGGFRHLIVTDEGGNVAGLLSIKDVARALLSRQGGGA